MVLFRKVFDGFFYPVIAKGKDLEFQLKVSYPKTPDGKENFLQFQKHIEAGDELKLDGKYITEFIGSNWWTRLFGDVQVEELTMGPLSIPLSAPIQIEFWSPTYSSEKLSYVELKLEKQGTKELTISNVHQQIPFKINFLVNKVTNNWSFKFEGNWSGENILTVRRSLAIKKILNTGGEIRLTALSNGSSDMYQIPRGEFSESQNNTLIFLDKLCAIQDLFGKEFLYPEDGGIHKEDIEKLSLISPNKGFGERGADTYSIWLWKGGPRCHHKWERRTYVSASKTASIGPGLARPPIFLIFPSLNLIH